MLSELLDEATALQSFWPEVRETPLNASQAFDILVVWSHLRRYDCTRQVAVQFSEFVAQESTALCLAVLKSYTFSADAWMEAIKQAHECTFSDLDEAHIRTLYDELDRHCLVAYALDSLVSKTALSDREQVDCFVHETGRVVRLLGEWLENDSHCGVVCLGLLVQDSQEYRHDLFQLDFRLWVATLHIQIICKSWLILAKDKAFGEDVSKIDVHGTPSV
ncbi:MAG: hypothetical protein A2360_04305 [Candidatus Staskawiczbacteria bacterium RIFOXYB1_FULL_32_11]|nr:MAG: hypothetical protein A2360_04305 [Candidatus Staskawiczbacteria bacterium RIFOXYB1_FULL_32_11]